MNGYNQMQPVFSGGAQAAPQNYFASAAPGGQGPGHPAPVMSPPIMAPGVMPLNPNAGQMPVAGNTGIVPPQMQTAVMPQTGPYYPGAAGAPSGITNVTPGVQAVTGAISGLPGVANGAGGNPHHGGQNFDRDAYHSAIQAWHAQRTPGMTQDARQDWRALRPDRHTFGMPSA